MLTSQILRRVLGSLITAGSLRVVLPGGQCLDFGDGSGEPLQVRFTDRAPVWALCLDPELRTGELFTEGRLLMEIGTVYDFLCLVLKHAAETTSGPWGAALDRLRTLSQAP